MPVSHIALVRRAGDWLRNTRHCHFVASELTCTRLSEIPDVIGWANQISILVECKTSLSDFRADKEKPHRQWDGLGQERWFFAPKGLIPDFEVPSGWGLLELDIVCRVKVKPQVRTATEGMLLNERALLISAAHRALEAVALVKPLSIGMVEG